MAVQPLTVGSLFSGIGGIDLGLERAGMSVIWQSEIDPYACRVLRKHWPDVPNLGDITRIDWSTVEQPDVICGGYPCQPFSLAGTRQGEHDRRHLWPYLLDAIRHLRPRYALLENVTGHLSLGFDRVLGDLAEIGFDAEWSVVSACSVGASQMRRRLLIVAHTEGECFGAGLREGIASEEWRGRPGDSGGPPRIVECECCGADWCNWHTRHRWECGCACPWDASDDPQFGWWAIEPDVGRVAYGVPDRVDRMRAIGNAVVPAVAEYVGRIILDAARTFDAAVRPSPPHTHHTSAHRGADAAAQPHTTRTAESPAAPLGDLDRVGGRPVAEPVLGLDVHPGAGIVGAGRLPDRQDGAEGVCGDVADLGPGGCCNVHTRIQPQTRQGVNHK